MTKKDIIILFLVVFFSTITLFKYITIGELIISILLLQLLDEVECIRRLLKREKA